MRLQLILRSLHVANKPTQISPGYISQRFFASKKNDSNSDEEVPKQEKSKLKKNDDATHKLNTLLQQMVQEDHTKPKLNLARPKRQRELKSETGAQTVKSETVETKIISAVQNVASSIEGDKKQIESELLSKLLNGSSESASMSTNLSDIVKGMKIDREIKVPEMSRAQQVRQILNTKRGDQRTSSHAKDTRPMRRDIADENDSLVYSEPVDIFGSEPLGIFTTPFDDAKPTVNDTWKKLQERELRLAITHPPANYFQEMILWTEQRKIWKFPIDNEQGMEDEQSVYFAEHVFLEKHLEPWCPSKGPVRHFMELVCVGLSKNCYMTVKDKREHIEWYKNYFEDKLQLLKDVGAMPTEKQSKQIDAD